MTAKMHRMHLPKVGEGVIYLPGGVPYQADDVQQFPLGAFMRIGNKEYVYAKAGNTLNTEHGAKNSLQQKVAYTSIGANYAAGVTQISVDVSVSISEDELVGGEVVCFTGSGTSFTRGITGNTAVSGSGTVTLDLDSPTPRTLTTSNDAEIMASPYSSVKEENNEWSMVMGLPCYPATVGQFVWLQVSGPRWVSPQSEVGGAINTQQAVFRSDGGLGLPSTNASAQLAGVVIATAYGGSAQGAPFIMLQIAH